jgi:hypothetical protein
MNDGELNRALALFRESGRAETGSTVQVEVLMGRTEGPCHPPAGREEYAMTRRSLIFLAPCALWAQSGWILSNAPGAMIGVGQAGPVSNKPFSGVETRHMTQVLGDGTHVDRSDTSNFYRDAAGRMRSESPQRVLIYDAVTKQVYDLNPANKTYTKSAEDSTLVSIAVVNGGTYVRGRSGNISSRPTHVDLGISAQAERSVVTNTEELPPQFLSGAAVKGSRITSTIPPGTFGNDREVKIVNERWYSDDLQVLVKSTYSDPRFGTTTYELTNIVQGSPNPALFQVPGDYREKPADQ